LDDEGIRDIADVLTSEKGLFAEGEPMSTIITDPTKKDPESPAWLKEEEVKE